MTEYLEGAGNISQGEIAQIFDDVSFWTARFGALLFREIEFRPNLRILDLGCGTGFPLFELAHTFGRSCFVAGVDIWREALARAAVKQNVHQAPNVGIAVADGAALPFGDAAFDLVTSNLGLNNFEKPAAVAAEVARVLKRSGRMVLTSNIRGNMAEFYEVYRRVLVETGKAERLAKLDENENHRGTVETITALLGGAGLRVRRVVVEPFVIRYADGSALLRHPLTRFGFLEGWKGVVEEADQKAVFAAIEERLNALAKKQGELRMTVQMMYMEAEK